MRLKKLTMQAFGPFNDKVVIDFEKNNINKGLLLITGDTGSGKTTIFDAICFALYGTTSSLTRLNNSLRSDYAKLDKETYVELEFYYKNKLYIVNRSPEYIRKNKRGSGTTISNSKASFEINGVILTKFNEVTKAITDLIGLDYKQFRQVAMLSQGEFTKFLLANSSEKTDIFRKIFNTEFYLTFQNKLKHDKLLLEDRFKIIKEKLNDEKNILEPIININLLNNHEIVESLNNKKLDLETKLKDIKKNRIEINKKLQEIKNQISSINKINENIKILNDSKLKITELNKIDINELEFKYNYNINVASKLENELSLKNKEEKSLKENNNKLNKYEMELKIKINEFNKNKDKFSKIDNYLDELNKITKEINDKKEILKEYNKYLDLKNDESFIKLIEIIKICEQENSVYDDMRKKYYLNVSYVLASNLKDNEACPVCGSLKHPKLALKSYDITKEELEKEEVKVNNLNDNRKKLESKVEIINKELEKFHFDDISKTKKDLNNLEIKVNDLNNEYKTINDNKKVLDKRIIELNENIKFIKEDINTNKKNIDILLKNIDNLYLVNKTNYLEYKKLYLDNKELNNLNNDIKEYYNFRNKLEGVINTLSEYENKKLINLNDLEKEYDLLSKEYEDVDLEYRNNDNNLTRIDLALEKIKDILNEYELVNKKYKINKIVCDTANGNLNGKLKITFENYVQSYYLNYVLIEANKRLNKMTDNRYLLTKKEDNKLNIKTGLDFNVFDSYTGKERDVTSLSGGEKFKASLALALGLSDVISNNVGGIKIDSLFIDEGFGSLDSESLNQAINILDDLAFNDKLIGVISHVSELKNRINNKIVIKKNMMGSILSIEGE